MLYIEKQNPNLEVRTEIDRVKRTTGWSAVDKNDSQLVRACFDLLNKKMIKEQLLQEQHGLCAYCMRRIQNNTHMTIEHLLSIRQSGEDALSYVNMVACCDGGRTSKADAGSNKVLCCDAAKGDRLLHISPFNRIQLEKIRYNRNGKILTYPKDEIMEHDINTVLKLNGLVDENTGNIIADTSTQLVMGRRSAYRNFETYIRGLANRNRLSRGILENKIREIESASSYIEYTGVWLYFLKRKLRAL